MHDRLKLASEARKREATLKDGLSAQQVEAMEIDRQKRNKMEMERKAGAVLHGGNQMDGMMVDGMAGNVLESTPGVSQRSASASRLWDR